MKPDIIDQDDPSGLKWLAVAQMLDGRKCLFCGFEWTCRDDVYKRAPIAASTGAKDIACKPCWDSRFAGIVPPPVVE